MQVSVSVAWLLPRCPVDDRLHGVAAIDRNRLAVSRTKHAAQVLLQTRRVGDIRRFGGRGGIGDGLHPAGGGAGSATCVAVIGFSRVLPPLPPPQALSRVSSKVLADSFQYWFFMAMPPLVCVG